MMKPIRFLIGVIKPVRFGIEKFVEFFYELFWHVDYTTATFAETAYLLARAAHADFTIAVMDVANRLFWRAEHSDFTGDAIDPYLRMWAYCESVSLDVHMAEVAMRLYGDLDGHVDVTGAEMDIMVIRPIRVYENNNRLISDALLTVKEMTILELT